MNCIVTAGPTYEPLDDVRRLTNFSTGRLGTELANDLTRHGHQVTLLLGEMATYTGQTRSKRVERFSTTDDLRKKMRSLANKKIHAVFHAAAVSDFSFGDIFTRSQAGKLSRVQRAKKIPTRDGRLLAELLPTPKIISKLRQWFPTAILVGWKYEADGNRSQAVLAARRQIAECLTDLCVANGPAYGSGFGLVTATEKPVHLKSSTALFTALERLVR
ncbi:MAG TPA: phosphopantothenoylcysteine decarboxylase [Desulfuromonadaceae bacterium]|nr:phosphopantothenoylcysteine decarboxylase [Desulfuromonadaceae bacterium]